MHLRAVHARTPLSLWLAVRCEVKLTGLAWLQAPLTPIVPDSYHPLQTAPNFLNRSFKVSTPQVVWVKDVNCMASRRRLHPCGHGEYGSHWKQSSICLSPMST